MKKIVSALFLAALVFSCGNGRTSAGDLTVIPTFIDPAATTARSIAVASGDLVDQGGMNSAMAPVFLTGFKENQGEYKVGDSFKISLFKQDVTVTIKEENEKPVYHGVYSDQESFFKLTLLGADRFDFHQKVLIDWQFNTIENPCLMYVETSMVNGLITADGYTGEGISLFYYLEKESVGISSTMAMSCIAAFETCAKEGFSGVISWWAAVDFSYLEQQNVVCNMKPTMDNMSTYFNQFNMETLYDTDKLEKPSFDDWSLLIIQEQGKWSSGPQALGTDYAAVWKEKTGSETNPIALFKKLYE